MRITEISENTCLMFNIVLKFVHHLYNWTEYENFCKYLSYV